MLATWSRWATVERGLSDRTVATYRRELERLAASSPRPLEALGPDDLRAFVHARGGRPATVARRVAALRSFYAFLLRSGRRTDDPSALLDRPRVKRGLPRPVEHRDEAFRRLPPLARLVAVFLAETGLRISEACSVREDLPVASELVVMGKGGKERRVPLTAEARRALTGMGGQVPWGPRQVQRYFRAAGFTPHRLRHTLATELAAADVDLSVIQDLLGHASPATTRIYQRNETSRLRAGLERRNSLVS